jgi:hypothetical protein
MRRSVETFLALLTALEKNPSVKAACDAVGISERVFYQWISRSQAGDPAFVFEYIDEGTALHQAVKHAQSIFYQSLAGAAEHRALAGHTAQVFFRGRPMYRLREEYMLMADDALADLQRCGVDVFERDEDGKLVPVLEHHAPPVQLQLGILSGRLPKVYGSKIEHNVNQKTQLGVHIVKQPALAPPVPVQIVAPSLPPPSEEVEEGIFVESNSDDDLDFLTVPTLDTIAAQPVADVAAEAIKPVVQALAEQLAETEEEPDMQEDEHEHDADAWSRHRARHAPRPAPEEPAQGVAFEPSGHNPAINRAPTPMRAQLEELLRAKAAAPSATPVRPPPPMIRGSGGSSDPVENVGLGVVRPGGVKVG